MHFGLEPYIPIVLYTFAVICFLLTIFWKPMVGIYFVVPLLPLQTIRYRINDYPLGSSIIGIMLVGVMFGLLKTGKPMFPKSSWTRTVWIYICFTYLSLWMGLAYVEGALPFPGNERFSAWQNYMVMPLVLLVTAAAAPSTKQIKVIVLLMCLSILVLDKSFWNTVADRDFSSYSEDLHEDGGSMGYAGANGLAAFAAQATAFLIALATFEKRKWRRLGYYALAFYSMVCLMYSLSRGGYVAVLLGCLVIGLLKDRKILLLLGVFALTWTAVVPPAVEQRVDMTYDEQNRTIDHSSETRLDLWGNAMEVFRQNPIIGTGFETYRYMKLNQRTDGGTGYYADTHNYFVKVLVETGVIGLLLLIWILLKSIREGYRLFRSAKEPLFQALGLGLVGWVTCAIAANMFGDRWTFLQVNGYMWVLIGLVIRASQIGSAAAAETAVVVTAEKLDAPRVPSLAY